MHQWHARVGARIGWPTVDEPSQPSGARRRRGPFAPGDRVQLTGPKQRLHTITLAAGKEFHTSKGAVAHDDLIGRAEGFVVTTTGGTAYLALRPLLSDYVLSMPRGAAVVYPKDAAAIVGLADIFPGAHVVEAGVGSGALSCSLLRAVGDEGRLSSYERREDFAAVARTNVETFFGGPHPAWTLTVGDLVDTLATNVAHGVDDKVDRVVLDMLAPWECVEAVARSLVAGGVLVAYVATTTQLARTVETLRADGRFTEPQPQESVVRGWHVEGLAVRPEHRMIGHTGFLVTARRLAEGTVLPPRRLRPSKGAYGPDYDPARRLTRTRPRVHQVTTWPRCLHIRAPRTYTEHFAADVGRVEEDPSKEVTAMAYDTPRDPERLHALEHRLAQTQSELSAVTAQNERLAGTLREARDQIVTLKAEVDRLAQPPSGYGVFLELNDDGTVDIFTAGRKMRVAVHPEIESADLLPGQRGRAQRGAQRRGHPRLRAARRGRDAQGAARGRRPCPGRRPRRRGARGPAGLAAARHPAAAGDTLLLEPRSQLLFERLPARGRGAGARGGARHLLRRHRRPRRADRADRRRRRAAVPAPRPVPRAPAAPPRRASCSTALPAAARRSSPRRSPTRWPRRWPRRPASERAGRYFLNIKGPELLNKYVGETERQIRLVFQRAREKTEEGWPVIVFFDEMDSLFRTRGTGISSPTSRPRSCRSCSPRSTASRA